MRSHRRPRAGLAAALPLLSLLACERGRPSDPPGDTTTTTAGTGEGSSPNDGEFSMRYGARTIQVFAEPSLAPEVDRLFALFRDLQAEAVEISAQTRIPIGWTTLSFADDGEHLTVREPDYDGDPEAATRPDISVSLATLARQRRVLEQVGVQGEAIDFDQEVLAIVGVLDRAELMLFRVESPGGRMTGWRVTPAEGVAEADEIEFLPVHAILRARPELLDVLLLPAGYLALYSGEQLTTIVNENDEVVWDWTVDGSLPRDHEETLDRRPFAPRPEAQPLLEPIE